MAGVSGVPGRHCGLTDTACELDLRQFTAGAVSTPPVIRTHYGYIGAVVVSPSIAYAADLTRPLLEACVAICRSCGDECERHAHMPHCRACAQACRHCEQACRELLGALR